MIVPMKKVTILSLATHRDESLDALRDLGVLHVTPLQTAATGDVEVARRAAEEARSVYSVLERLAAKLPPTPSARPPAETGRDGLEKAQVLINRKRERAEALQRLNDTIARLEPFGDFNPALITELSARGISVRLFKADTQAKLNLPDDAMRLDLSRDNKTVHFALINAEGWSSPYATVLPLPERPLADVTRERDRLLAEEADDDGTLMTLARSAAVVASAVAEAEDRLRWLETRDGMSREGALTVLQGFLPAGDLPKLHAEATRLGWGWLAEEPAEDDPVPTLIDSPKWIRPIHMLFDTLGILPGYREVDVSPIFLVFFSIFFAMLINDVVYGLLFLGLTVLIKAKWKNAPRHLVPLLAILSVATMIWGALTGSYLGFGNLPAPLKRMQVEALLDVTKIQSFCFFLGAIQLTVAHGWNVILQRKSTTALSQVGWIGCCWSMYALANNLVLGLPLVPGTGILLVFSIFLILVFTVPFDKFRKEFASLVTLPLSIIGNFGDVVSYLRLYLVGSASAVLIQAFKEIAFPPGATGALAFLGGVLILFAVHVLNILLGALGVLVHGIRLNALEFSSHMGIQWLGRPYDPFRKQAVTLNSCNNPERTPL
ncbi:MAG: hypothetical protein PHV28_09230 [Kiritimatiellae bacterium]|nr:hypothetical protein [Kiritimatiellia bacterium]